MPKVELDPKTRPAEFGTLMVLWGRAIVQFSQGAFVEGVASVVTGLLPYGITLFLEKTSRYKPSVHGEMDINP